MSRLGRTTVATKTRKHETTNGFVFVLSLFAFWCCAWLLAISTLAAQQAPDRSKPPEPGPPPALHLPQIQKRQLSNGLPVWIVELHKVPVAQVSLLILSGAADDPPRRFGLANMTASMLEQGAGSRSALSCPWSSSPC